MSRQPGGTRMAFGKAWEGPGRERKPTEGLRVGAAGGGITGRHVVGAPARRWEHRRLLGGLVALGRLLKPNSLIGGREGLQLGVWY